MKGHPKEGENTMFVEKVLNCLGINYTNNFYFETLVGLNKSKLENGILTEDDLLRFQASLYPFCEDCKGHTIREKNHFNAGDFVKLAVWSDVPNTKNGRVGAYHSPQIIIAPDVEVKKVWEFEISGLTVLINNTPINSIKTREIANNDGLDMIEFRDWFCDSPDFKKGKVFQGQIICWNDSINY